LSENICCVCLGAGIFPERHKEWRLTYEKARYFVELMKNGIQILTVLFLIPWIVSSFSPAKADSLGELTFITENYAPYNYKKDGEVRGTTIELLLKMFKQAGTDRGLRDIKVMNWARGYKLAQDTKNTVLFSTTRSEIRENLFKWVGPVSATKISIIGKKNNGIKINSNKDLIQYRIGAVRDDIGELLLLSRGVDRKNIYRTNSSEHTAKMLIAGRIDLWAYESTVAFWNLQEQGENPDHYETKKMLEESHLYFAIQKDTSDHLVAKLQAALDKVRSAESSHEPAK
jgi:polar amino acid transport system substrate-binding protein